MKTLTQNHDQRANVKIKSNCCDRETHTLIQNNMVLSKQQMEASMKNEKKAETRRTRRNE